MMLHRHDLECRAKGLGSYPQGQGRSEGSNAQIKTVCSLKLLNRWGEKTPLYTLVHYFLTECTRNAHLLTK